MKNLLPSAAGLSCLIGLFHVGLAAPGGPPPYLTAPLMDRLPDASIDHGHRVFTDNRSGPQAPALGSATYVPASLDSSLSLSTGSDRDVSALSNSYEGETTGTAAAANGVALIAGSNRVFPGNCSASAAPGAFGDCAPLAYGSGDGGVTWSKVPLPRLWGGYTFGTGFDPSIDVGSDGTMYYSYIVAPISGNYPNAIVMVKWNVGGGAKLTPVTFNTSLNFDDKQYLAVDRSASPFAGRVYVSWDRNRALNQTLEIAYSADHGVTWSAPIKVNDGPTPFERVIGAYPAIDQQTGVVYDSWHDYGKGKIFIDKSFDGGASWGTDVAVTTTHTGFGTDIGCVGGRAQGPAHALRVGPSGKVYLVYADKVSLRGYDILMTTSIDGGASWSLPMTLNDDVGAADQFHPTLSVEPNGLGGDKVTVTFYDRRDDPTNCFAHVYATQSLDSGATWSANVRQTSAPSDFDGNPNGPGDYSSSAPFRGAVWPFFADHRASNPETAPGGAFDVYTVNVQ